MKIPSPTRIKTLFFISFNFFVLVFTRSRIIRSFIIPSKRIRILELSVEYIYKERLSILRWGDGETAILLGRNLLFQRSCSALRDKLRMILSNYRSDLPYALAIPVHQVARYRSLDYERKMQWGRTLLLFHFFLSSDVLYCDSFIFRKMALDQLGGQLRLNKQINVIDMIEFLSAKDISVVYVASEKNYKNLRSRLPTLIILHISIPSSDLYEHSMKTVDKILVSDAKFVNEVVFLISGGSAAKLIVSSLAGRVWIIDVGQFWE